jgi:hypothetical protein
MPPSTIPSIFNAISSPDPRCENSEPMLPRSGKALSQPHYAWPVLAVGAYLLRYRDKPRRGMFRTAVVCRRRDFRIVARSGNRMLINPAVSSLRRDSRSCRTAAEPERDRWNKPSAIARAAQMYLCGNLGIGRGRMLPCRKPRLGVRRAIGPPLKRAARFRSQMLLARHNVASITLSQGACRAARPACCGSTFGSRTRRGQSTSGRVGTKRAPLPMV